MSCHLACACQVIARTLHGLRYNDEPAEHTGTATLCRLSTPGTHYGQPPGRRPLTLTLMARVSRHYHAYYG